MMKIQPGESHLDGGRGEKMPCELRTESKAGVWQVGRRQMRTFPEKEDMSSGPSETPAYVKNLEDPGWVQHGVWVEGAETEEAKGMAPKGPCQSRN
jgi:hypothetical protein